jgi:hypothetical protein
MKRAMTNRIIAGLLAALSLIAASSRASAAVWRWGCQGQLGGQQVVFNRGALFVAESKKLFGDARRLNIDTIDKMVADETANKNEKTSYDSNNGNGFAKAMEFIRRGDEKRKVVLTEKSSHKISARHRLICGRDEDIDIFKKVYRYQREDEPARDITMQCIEYQLSTRGGRPCD